MRTAVSELRDAHDQLQTFVDSAAAPELAAALDTLERSANEAGKAWSRSWCGYHSRVYYKGLKPPPPGAHFSTEWGLKESFATDTTGDWEEYDFDVVKSEVLRRAGNPDLGRVQEIAKDGEKLFEERRDQIISILDTALSRRKDSYLDRLIEDAKKTRLVTASDLIEALRPSGTLMSRDTLALTQGLWTPPHISVVAEVAALRNPAKACAILAKIAKNAGAHLERLERDQRRAERLGTNVFIGHGRSPLWKDLKDFVQDRLRLPWDEFNRVPVAGITNIARLSEMLDAAAIAFLVMTAEDGLADGKMHARMNVVHEAGLFQGRLGFTKTIILLEEGCEEFSNIQGLGQIPFPKGNIKAVLEQVRQVLEREGLIEGE